MISLVYNSKEEAEHFAHAMLEEIEAIEEGGFHPPLAFVKEQILANGPALLPVWLASVVLVGAALAGTDLPVSFVEVEQFRGGQLNGCQSGLCELMTPG
jgi:hypothetical protein